MKDKTEIDAHDDPEQWQLREIREGIAELDSGEEVSHEEVSQWLNSWGKRNEGKAPQ